MSYDSHLIAERQHHNLPAHNINTFAHKLTSPVSLNTGCMFMIIIDPHLFQTFLSIITLEKLYILSHRDTHTDTYTHIQTHTLQYEMMKPRTYIYVD